MCGLLKSFLLIIGTLGSEMRQVYVYKKGLLRHSLDCLLIGHVSLQILKYEKKLLTNMEISVILFYAKMFW